MYSQLVCPGTINTAVEPPACNEGWVVQLVPEVFDPSQLELETAGLMFSTGFLFWFTWWVIRLPLVNSITGLIRIVNKYMDPRG